MGMLTKFTKFRVGLEVTIFSQQQSQGLAVSSDEHLLATSTGAVLGLPAALSVLAQGPCLSLPGSLSPLTLHLVLRFPFVRLRQPPIS